MPSLKIHVWGGLGSQLYSLLLARKLNNAFQDRKIKLLFHQSGVSKRILQIPAETLADLNYVEIQDFAKSNNTLVSESSIRMRLATFLRKSLADLLIKSGFLARVNTEEEFLRLKPWILSIRGHYTGVNHLKEGLVALMGLFKLTCQDFKDGSATVHFRLGDLIDLQDKTHIDPKSIFEIIDGIGEFPVDILSDSDPAEVNEVLNLQTVSRNIRSVRSLDIGDTIRVCYDSEVFIGTNSKISVWIAVFRSLGCGRYSTFLPASFRLQLSSLLSECELRKITFY